MSTTTNIKRATEWKIFELQVALISDHALQIHLNDGIKWFQPYHYKDIVIERSINGRCGFPLCNRPPNSSPGSILRLSYSKNKIYDLEESKRFCSSTCIKKSRLYELSLDDSSPFTRKCLDTLRESAADTVDADIDDILNVIPSKPLIGGLSVPLHSVQKLQEKMSPEPQYGIDPSTANTSNTTESQVSSSGNESEVRNSECSVNSNSDVSSTKATNFIISDINDISRWAHTTFCPTLLSYDSGADIPSTAPSPPLSSIQSEVSAKSPSEHVDQGITVPTSTCTPNPENKMIISGILKANSRDRPASFTSGDCENKTKSNRREKKALSFGQDTVHVFKRGSKAFEQYTETEWAEKMYQKSVHLKEGRVGYSSESDESSNGSPGKPESLGSQCIILGNSTDSVEPPRQSTAQIVQKVTDTNGRCLPESVGECKSQATKLAPMTRRPCVASENATSGDKCPAVVNRNGDKSVKSSAKSRSSSNGKAAKKSGPNDSKAYPLKNRVVERDPAPVKQTTVTVGSEPDDIEGYVPLSHIQVDARTAISGLSFNPLRPDTYSAADKAEDEKILRELGLPPSSSEGYMEDDDEIDLQETDVTTSRTFFILMWMSLEDLFGYDAISWLNGVETFTSNSIAYSDEEVEECLTSNEENSNRAHVDAGSTHRCESIVSQVQRGISTAEGVINLSRTLNCSPSVLGHYTEMKRELISYARIDKCNPPLTSTQWAFLGLVLVDAILRKKVFIDCDVAAVVQDSWQSKFEVFAAGICGGAQFANKLLSDKELEILRQFFDMDPTEHQNDAEIGVSS